jgi:hypothetical protein
MQPMPTSAAAGSRDLEAGAYRYQRHQRENNRLCRIVERYYPEFTASLAEQGAMLPLSVQREFEDYLKCGRLENGVLRVQCTNCHAEHLVTFSCKRRGLLRAFCPRPFGPAFGCSKSLPAIFKVLTYHPGIFDSIGTNSIN